MATPTNSLSGHVRLFGNRDSAEAWEIRDFLKRSVVAFDWIELASDGDCQCELRLADLKDVRLPVVELPDGERLYGPSLREVATRFWFVAKERHGRLLACSASFFLDDHASALTSRRQETSSW